MTRQAVRSLERVVLMHKDADGRVHFSRAAACNGCRGCGWNPGAGIPDASEEVVLSVSSAGLKRVAFVCFGVPLALLLLGVVVLSSGLPHSVAIPLALLAPVVFGCVLAWWSGGRARIEQWVTPRVIRPEIS